MKLLAYPLTIIYYVGFIILLLVFHPIQWVAFNMFGYTFHKRVVDVIQIILLQLTKIVGTRITFHNSYKISTKQPLIIVSNHQSMYDIPPIMWYMRKHHVKFISKKELGRGIPSISYNLRHGGSVLIDRKNPKQALPAITKFAAFIKKSNYSAAIFPEGTRSRDGIPKDFQSKGLKILFKEIPTALVVPISINNSWKMNRYGGFPIPWGTHITFTIHKPLQISDFADNDVLIRQLEETIKAGIHI